MDLVFLKGENELALYQVSDIHVRDAKRIDGQPFWMKAKKEPEVFEDKHNPINERKIKSLML